MTNGIGTIHVRRQRRKLVVQGDGKTPRGQSFIRSYKEMTTPSMRDAEFKAEMTGIVEEMLAQETLPL